VDDLHLTPELMHALFRNELPPVVFANLVLNHLLALCPTCRDAIEHTYRDGGAEYQLDRAFAAAQRALDRERAARDGKARQARRDLAELLRTAPEEREARVRRANARFQSPLLVDLLIEEGRKLIHEAPREALRLATLARTVAERAPAGPGVIASRVRAVAHQANALRTCGDLSAADERFAEVRRLLQSEMIADTLAHAEVARLEASLRIDRRQFADAETLLAKAALLYRLARESKALTITLMKLAHLHHLRDEPRAAIEVNLEALRAIDGEKEPQLYRWARHNLATLLCEVEEYTEARRILAQLPDGEQRGTTKARRLWLEGRIARGMEERAQAERYFLSARRAFQRQNLPLYVGLCVIDLAELYLAEGRMPDLLALAHDLDALLGTPGLHDEAAKALLLFQSAVTQQIVSDQLLRQVRRRLQHLQTGQQRFSTACW
jgi:hypothetical protein